jgi:hypothetical protein
MCSAGNIHALKYSDRQKISFERAATADVPANTFGNQDSPLIRELKLQAYLNEFVFRFNRRFYPMTAFNSILGIAAHASAPTYETLYSGNWTHPIA